MHAGLGPERAHTRERHRRRSNWRRQTPTQVIARPASPVLAFSAHHPPASAQVADGLQQGCYCTWCSKRDAGASAGAQGACGVTLETHAPCLPLCACLAAVCASTSCSRPLMCTPLLAPPFTRAHQVTDESSSQWAPAALAFSTAAPAFPVAARGERCRDKPRAHVATPHAHASWQGAAKMPVVWWCGSVGVSPAPYQMFAGPCCNNLSSS